MGYHTRYTWHRTCYLWMNLELSGKYQPSLIVIFHPLLVNVFLIIFIDFIFYYKIVKLYLKGTEADKTWNGDFYFIVGSDPQFGLMDWYQNPDYNPEKADWTEEIISATLAVDKINKLSPKPRFFVICGDLSNEFPGK